MRMSHPSIHLIPAMLALLLAACGNKGDLVKPMPSTLPPPAPATEPASPEQTTTPTPSAQPTPAAKPPQDSGGH